MAPTPSDYKRKDFSGSKPQRGLGAPSQELRGDMRPIPKPKPAPRPSPTISKGGTVSIQPAPKPQQVKSFTNTSTSTSSAPLQASYGGGVEIADIAGQIMDTDSPLMRRADAKGRAYSNSRGLMNSSMGAEASQAATLDYVVPMAQTERTERGTDRRFDKQIAFDTEQNKLQREHEFKINEQKFGYDQALQMDAQKWQSGENALDRDWDLTLQKDQQGFVSGESVLDRDLTRSEGKLDREFTASESDKDRTLTTVQAELDRTFTGTENQLDRDNSMALAESEQDFRLNLSDKEYEQLLGITKVEFDNLLKLTDIEFENTMKMTKEDFKNALDVLAKEQDFSSTEAQKTRDFEDYMQEQGFDFTAMENQKDRDNSTALAQAEQDFRLTLSDKEYEQLLGITKVEFENLLTLTDVEFENTLEMTKEEFTNALTLLKEEQDFTANESLKDRLFTSEENEKAFDREVYLTDMKLTSDEFLATMDRDTRFALAEMEDTLRTKITAMELNDSQLKQVGDMVTSFHAQYQDAFRSILSNPDLDAETRNQLMRSMGDMLDTQIDMVAGIMGVPIGWDGDSFDPVNGTVDPNAPEPEPETDPGNGSNTTRSSADLPSYSEAFSDWKNAGNKNEPFFAYLDRVYGEDGKTIRNKDDNSGKKLNKKAGTYSDISIGQSGTVW